MENIDYKFDQHLNNFESDGNKFNKYLNSQEFVNNNTKRIPVCIVVDCSGSMKEYDGTNKTRIDRVNDGIELFYEKIRENIKTKKSVDVLIIQVGNEAKIIKNFSGTEKNPPKLNYLNEKNNLTEGVSLALDKLDERKKIYFAANIDYYQPWILIMSDGGLNKSFKKKEFRQIQQEVRNREMNCKLSVFPIYIQGKPMWNELEQKFVPIKPETYEERLTLMSEFSNSKERLINIDLADSSAFDGLFQFLHKSVNILKFTVHGSKTHISYLVQFLQLFHHQLTDTSRTYLILTGIENSVFHLINETADLGTGYRSLVASQ